MMQDSLDKFSTLVTCPHGWLGVRTNGFMAGLKKRWCLLMVDKLLWFDNPQSPPFNVDNARDGVRLHEVLSVEEGKSTPKGLPTFIITATNGVVTMVAPSANAQKAWIDVLKPSVAAARTDSALVALQAKHGAEGFLMVRDGITQRNRKCWVELRSTTLAYYAKRPDARGIPGPLQVLPFNFRTALNPSKSKDSFVLHLYTENLTLTLEGSNRRETDGWIQNIMDAIDACPVVLNPYERFIEELLQTPDRPADVFGRHPISQCVYFPLTEPLLPLSYGEISESGFYDSFTIEALRVSLSLSPGQAQGRYGTVSTPNTLVSSILTLCHEVRLLRNEVYFQLVKLTTNPPKPGDVVNLTHWHVLAALCASAPSLGKCPRFLQAHLKYIRTLPPTASPCPVHAVANYCEKSLFATGHSDNLLSTSQIKKIIDAFRPAGPLRMSVIIPSEDNFGPDEAFGFGDFDDDDSEFDKSVASHTDVSDQLMKDACLDDDEDDLNFQGCVKKTPSVRAWASGAGAVAGGRRGSIANSLEAARRASQAIAEDFEEF